MSQRKSKPNGSTRKVTKIFKKLRIVCIFDLMTKIKAQNVKFDENTAAVLLQYNLYKNQWQYSGLILIGSLIFRGAIPFHKLLIQIQHNFCESWKIKFGYCSAASV